MPKPFNGVISLDVRDSVADWGPCREEPAPEGAPNVLIVLYDDTGLAASEPYGGRIAMPTMQRLADDGLTYSQWHTIALCSPTRSCFLTGRNHHQNGFAQIAEGAQVKPQPGHFALCGEGLSIGRDSGFPFQGGRILEVEVNIGDDVYLDVEREFAAAMARD
jgi:hypothetical protein